MAHIRVGNRVYLIRGNWTKAQLRQQYLAFLFKYHSDMPFHQWLVQRGKVHMQTQDRTGKPWAR